MKNHFLVISVLFFSLFAFGQQKNAPFKDGEFLAFKMSYSGFFKAGTATLSLKEEALNGQKIFHATGKGWTTGMIKWFFEVNDDYQSYFDKKSGKPYVFKRKINEGGHKKHKQITFNHEKNTAYVQNFRNKKDTLIRAVNVQDMISSFYFLRSYNTKNMKKGEEIKIDMFFDNHTYPFKLRFLGSETIKTKFGKVKTQKFRPIVKAGRVFKAQESVTVWITADKNKIPVKIKASLAVGSLRAELSAYKGLANPFKTVLDSKQ
ncbi:DUF3108 domain-containing protein [Tenacibaculum finnmarkense]|uniref:DUF3108 domain-containing protein n=1 Tax=Tenacibaculum finnmarkense TaxID=2781243 RepID=UPI000739018C|nr:DUF3108 domain-containing protein [Tenacibaculum finnmarkense]ALU73891.1 ATP-dependent exonuclease [Tenacibaculum dicentrarchi]MCD8444905.1 DUF3108 domain-containing protein [Tenacibaculum finnmarkense genomovar ulcerans]